MEYSPLTCKAAAKGKLGTYRRLASVSAVAKREDQSQRKQISDSEQANDSLNTI
jgi:hypothetical protein